MLNYDEKKRDGLLITDGQAKGLVALNNETTVAYLISPSYPGRVVRLMAEGEKWAREKIASGSQFTRDWEIVPK